jgi:hypothetical protein
VDEVVVFGRTPAKLAAIGDQFRFVTTTDLDTVISDAWVDLVDMCLPTRLPRARFSGRNPLCQPRHRGHRLHQPDDLD